MFLWAREFMEKERIEENSITIFFFLDLGYLPKLPKGIF